MIRSGLRPSHTVIFQIGIFWIGLAITTNRITLGCFMVTLDGFIPTGKGRTTIGCISQAMAGYGQIDIVIRIFIRRSIRIGTNTT